MQILALVRVILNIEYFKSIKDKVDPKFDLLKKLLNVIHWLVIPYLVLCFLYVLFLYVSKAPQKYDIIKVQ